MNSMKRHFTSIRRIVNKLTFFNLILLIYFCNSKNEFQTKVVQVLRKQNDKKYKWVHCDRNFAGYYETDYTSDNWELLGEAMKLNNNVTI
jgi:hypothetical protein